MVCQIERSYPERFIISYLSSVGTFMKSLGLLTYSLIHLKELWVQSTVLRTFEIVCILDKQITIAGTSMPSFCPHKWYVD